MAEKQQKVLFLDDDAEFLEMFQNVMESYAGDSWEIHVAKNAGKPRHHSRQTNRIGRRRCHMPVVDGMQFLKLLNRKHPNVVKVILSGGATEQERATCLSLGARVGPRQGRNTKELAKRLFHDQRTGRHSPEEGFRGVLRRVSLQDVLQMECLSRSSAVLDISTRN